MKSKLSKFLAVMSVLAVAVLTVSLPALSMLPEQAFAQQGTTNGDAGGFVPCGNSVNDPCTIGHLFKGFIVIINYLIVMAGFVAVLAIVYAGFMMVYSRGDDGTGLKEAKGRLSGAVIGLVIVAIAFVIINALLAGSFSIGVCNGGTILTNPVEYIRGAGNCS